MRYIYRVFFTKTVECYIEVEAGTEKKAKDIASKFIREDATENHASAEYTVGRAAIQIGDRK